MVKKFNYSPKEFAEKYLSPPVRNRYIRIISRMSVPQNTKISYRYLVSYINMLILYSPEGHRYWIDIKNKTEE
jgi:hypothetical protein